MDEPGQPTGRSRPTALGLSGAFAALAFGGWCTVHGVLSLAPGAPRPQPGRVADQIFSNSVPRDPVREASALNQRVDELSGVLGRSSQTQRPEVRPERARGPLTPQQLFDRTVPAVVRVNVFDASMQTRKHGSGFFVQADGLVVTNFHVIDNANFATVETTDGTTLFVEGVAAENESADLALLKVATGAKKGAARTTAVHMPTVSLGGDAAPPVGTKVYAIGHPRGLRNVLSEGLISGHGEGAEGSGLPSLQTTTPLSPGSSGGPLLTADGNVVGVTTAGLSDSQNLNFAVPVAHVHRLIDAFQRGPGTLRKLASSGTQPLNAEVAKAIDRIHVLMSRDQTREAVELAESLREKYGDHYYYWSSVGHMHIRLRNLDLAAECYHKCLALKPDFGAAYVCLADIYIGQKKYEKAIEASEKASKLMPSEPQAYFNAGTAYARLGQPDKAIPFYQYALRLKPQDPEIFLRMAEAYFELGQYSNASALFNTAAVMRPKDPHPRTRLGVTLHAMGKLDEARKELLKALSLRPQHAEAYAALGAVYHAQKDPEAARAAWQNAVRFDPKGRWGEAGRKALAGLPPD